MRHTIILLLLVGLAFATVPQPFSSNPTPPPPSTEVLNQLTILVTILVPLMLTMIALAAAVYVVGQMFGSETGARANVWAQSMLVAVGISGAIILMLYAILPNFLQGQLTYDLDQIITSIYATTHTALLGLIVVLASLSAAAYAIGQAMGAETRARATVWATGLLSGAIISTIIYVIVFEFLSATGPLGTFFTGNPYFIPAHVAVLINISFFITFLILITYLVSKFFKVPEWEAYLNIELSNLMNSFLVVIFVVGLFAVGTEVASAYAGGATDTPPQVVISYMRSTVADSVLRGLFDVYQIQACTSILSTFSRRIGEYVLTQTYKVFPGLDTFVSIANVLGVGLVAVYGSVSAQIGFLYLVDGLMVPFFLPAGLILRFFPPTRDAGAFLISLAFGFQIVYPATYLLNKDIYTDIGGRAYESPAVLIGSLCGPFSYGVWGFLLNPDANPIFSAIPGGATVGRFLSRVVSESLLNAVSMSYFLPIMQHVASLSLLALFMPALSMVVTIAFINAMTKFLVAKV